MLLFVENTQKVTTKLFYEEINRNVGSETETDDGT